MRWLKHMTATRDDEKVAELISKSGPEGYGLWWMVLETIAANMEKGSEKCSLNYPLGKWAAKLQVMPQNVCRQVAVMGAVGLLEVRRDGAMLELCAPKLLKYRDEYARKSGQYPDKVPDKKQIQNTDTEADTEADKEPPTPNAPNGALTNGHKPSRNKNGKRTTEQIQSALGERLPWWENFWKVYPCHDGMNPCMDAFERKVNTRELALDVYHGAQKYAEKIKSDPAIKVKFGQGWINDERWTDENTVSTQPLTLIERAKLMAKEKANGTR